MYRKTINLITKYLQTKKIKSFLYLKVYWNSLKVKFKKAKLFKTAIRYQNNLFFNITLTELTQVLNFWLLSVVISVELTIKDIKLSLFKINILKYTNNLLLKNFKVYKT